jgi:[NiFe] hydrogenase large subunit
MAHQARVSEHVARSWYEGKTDRHPYEGETKPLQENPKYRPGDGKYSWLKAPRYEGHPCEVGPLARVLIAYGKGHKEIVASTNHVMKTLGIEPKHLFSTLGRTGARGIETMVIGERMQGWVMELVANIKNGDPATYQPYEMPDSGMGVGLNDVPRGALGHWVQINGKKIKNYQ